MIITITSLKQSLQKFNEVKKPNCYLSFYAEETYDELFDKFVDLRKTFEALLQEYEETREVMSSLHSRLYETEFQVECVSSDYSTLKKSFNKKLEIELRAELKKVEEKARRKGFNYGLEQSKAIRQKIELAHQADRKKLLLQIENLKKANQNVSNAYHRVKNARSKKNLNIEALQQLYVAK